MDDKITLGDVAHVVSKGLIGLIPFAGAPASELLGLLVASPLEKRRAKWMTEIGERLRLLEENKKIDFAALSSNEIFVDTVLHATSIALKTSIEEKIQALRNAILNTALNDAPDQVLYQIFINLINDFTAWHLKILVLVRDPSAWFRENKMEPPNLLMGGLNSVILSAFPSLKEEDELLRIIWSDLRRAGLHDSGELGTMMSGSGLLVKRTTALGDKFLKFISEP